MTTSPAPACKNGIPDGLLIRSIIRNFAEFTIDRSSSASCGTTAAFDASVLSLGDVSSSVLQTDASVRQAYTRARMQPARLRAARANRAWKVNLRNKKLDKLSLFVKLSKLVASANVLLPDEDIRHSSLACFL